jgi:hypothetical protein
MAEYLLNSSIFYNPHYWTIKLSVYKIFIEHSQNKGTGMKTILININIVGQHLPVGMDMITLQWYFRKFKNRLAN